MSHLVAIALLAGFAGGLAARRGVLRRTTAVLLAVGMLTYVLGASYAFTFLFVVPMWQAWGSGTMYQPAGISMGVGLFGFIPLFPIYDAIPRVLAWGFETEARAVALKQRAEQEAFPCLHCGRPVGRSRGTYCTTAACRSAKEELEARWGEKRRARVRAASQDRTQPPRTTSPRV